MSCWTLRRTGPARPRPSRPREGTHHGCRLAQLPPGGGFEAGEPVHRDDLNRVAPGLLALREPGLERLLGTALDHVQQPRRPGPVADPGQVDDHGHVLVPAAGVPPDVLIDADRGDPGEPSPVGLAKKWQANWVLASTDAR